jgi:dienelactone hydrolase
MHALLALTLHGTLVVANINGNTVTIIDVATHQTVATVPGHTLTVIDLAPRVPSVVRTIDLGADYHRPHGSSFLPGDTTMLVTVEDAPARRSPPIAEQVTFRNGDVTLAGTLYLPAEAGPHPAIVAFHASNGGTRDYDAYQHLARALPPAGFAVLLFDRRGEGASTGDRRTASFTDLASDGVAGVSYLASRSDIDRSRIGVWGMSQGGWLAPLAATMSRDIAFVIAVSAPAVGPAGQMDYTARYALEAAGQPPSVVDHALRVRAVVNDYYRGRGSKSDAGLAIDSIRGQPWFGQVFIPNGGTLPDDPTQTKWYATMDYDPLLAVAKVTVPMAFFFAEHDAYVPVEESMTRTRQAARVSDLTIRRVASTDHYMETGKPESGGPTSRQYVDQLLEWLHRHEGSTRARGRS